MRDLTIVFHDAGGGHRNAAGALKTVLESQEYPWRVRLLNLQDLLDPIDVVQRATGRRLQDGYNLLLRKGWTRLDSPAAGTAPVHHSFAPDPDCSHPAQLLGAKSNRPGVVGKFHILIAAWQKAFAGRCQARHSLRC